jgi:hypothetical protein
MKSSGTDGYAVSFCNMAKFDYVEFRNDQKEYKGKTNHPTRMERWENGKYIHIRQAQNKDVNISEEKDITSMQAFEKQTYTPNIFFFCILIRHTV